MANIRTCPTRPQLAAELAGLLSQRAAQAGAALRMLAHCHIDRHAFEEDLIGLRQLLEQAEKLADEFDCSDRVASEAA